MNLRRLWIPKLGGWIFGSTVALGSLAPIAAPTVGGNQTCWGSKETTCRSRLGAACYLPGSMPRACAFITTPGGGSPGHVVTGVGHRCPSGCTANGNQPGGDGCDFDHEVVCYY
jgi:hypothetical protein